MSESLKLSPSGKRATESDTNSIAKNEGIFLFKNSYYYVRDGLVSEELTYQTLNMLSGLSKEEIREQLTEVWGVKRDVTLTEPSTTGAVIDNDMCLPVLLIRNNPTEKWVYRTDYNMEIVRDYTGLFEGKLGDIVKFVIHGVRTGEQRMNKLLLTGGAGIGKTKLFDLMNFVNISSTEFHNMMQQEKIISVQRATDISIKGLLYVDDFEGNIPLNFKNVTDTIAIKVNRLGVIDIPAKFISFSSTHTNALHSFGNEYKDRIAHFGIDGDNPIEQSEVFKKYGRDEYRYHTTLYIRRLILDCLQIDIKTAQRELVKLKTKYKVGETMLDEIIEIVKERLLSKLMEMTGAATPQVFYREGEYYILHRKKWKEMVHNTLEEEGKGTKFDFRKYQADLTEICVQNRCKVQAQVVYLVQTEKLVKKE